MLSFDFPATVGDAAVLPDHFHLLQTPVKVTETEWAQSPGPFPALGGSSPPCTGPLPPQPRSNPRLPVLSWLRSASVKRCNSFNSEKGREIFVSGPVFSSMACSSDHVWLTPDPLASEARRTNHVVPGSDMSLTKTDCPGVLPHQTFACNVVVQWSVDNLWLVIYLEKASETYCQKSS